MNSILLVVALIFVLILITRLNRLNGITGTRENYSDGAIGPYSFSSGNYAFGTRPSREYHTHHKLNFRYLGDYTNW